MGYDLCAISPEHYAIHGSSAVDVDGLAKDPWYIGDMPRILVINDEWRDGKYRNSTGDLEWLPLQLRNFFWLVRSDEAKIIANELESISETFADTCQWLRYWAERGAHFALSR
ncbi:MAG: hypothetical protein ACYCOU_06320 [Sulfobacillus sp.]